jgi:hypothetical protein
MRGSPLRRDNLLVGIFTIGIGGSILLVSLDIIRAPDSSFHAPRWIAGLAGGVFVLAGLSVLFRELSDLFTWSESLSGYLRTIQKMLVILIVASMAGIANWVAFGPGERSFSGSAGGGSLKVFFNGGDVMGRIVFGIGAILIDLTIVIALLYYIIKRLRPKM